MPKCCTKYLPSRKGDFVQVFIAIDTRLLCLGNNRVTIRIPRNHMEARVYLAHNSVTPLDWVVHSLLSGKTARSVTAD